MTSGFLGAVLLAASALSPAEDRMARAQQTVQKNPSYASAHSQLALALAQRARETADTAYYARAEQSIVRALDLDPQNLEALRARAWVLLGQHEFARALDVAQALNKRAPDDVMIYGLLTDAYLELGRYAEAEEAAQWMLDLRAGNVPGLTRAAYLRELFGDVEGALELMGEAIRTLPQDEVEERAWILIQMSHLNLSVGKLEPAELLSRAALDLFPGYHYALNQLARVRTAQGRHAEAADLQRQRYAAAPHPENLYALAEALAKAGRVDEAGAAFARFEAAALAESGTADNANHELVYYYADHVARPKEALRIARAEMARRQDVQTRHAYAWALHVNGRHAEAREELEKALAVGVRDATLFDHAAAIAGAAGDRRAAERYFRQSSELRAPRSTR